MEALIRREAGDPFVAPSVQERALDDQGEALAFLERMEAGEFDLLICMTGTGLVFFRDQLGATLAQPGGTLSCVERLGAALRRIAIISRGPKPLPILRELGVRADIVVPEPNTWKEIVDAVALRSERSILVQEYGRPNLEMNTALEHLGARVTPMVVYRWEEKLPADVQPLREAARRLAQRQFGCNCLHVVHPTRPQHLLLIAGELGLQPQVFQRLSANIRPSPPLDL